MMRAALLVTILLGQDVRFEVTPESVEKLAGEAVPLVEAVTGRAFKTRPVVRVAAREAVAAVLEKELLPQIERLHPEMTGPEREREAQLSARAHSKAMYGKFAVKTGEVLIVAENFPQLPRPFKARHWASSAPLKLILVHELAHALDHQLYPGLSDLAGFKTREELGTLNALIEGHAQQVMAEAARREKLDPVFKDLEDAILALPPNLDAAEKLLATIFIADHRFAYGDGRKFFEELLRTGPADVVDRVFTAPPKTKDVILFPARFLDPKAGPGRGRDLAPLLTALAGDFAKGWRSETASINAQDVRARFADLIPAAAVEEALKPYQHGGAVEFESEADPRVEFRVWLHETGSLEGGTRLYERLIDAEKEAFRRLGLHETEATVLWGPLKEAKFARNTTVTIRWEDDEGPRVFKRSWIHAGRAVAELTFDRVDIPAKDWVRIHDAVTEFLSKPFVPVK